MLDLFNKVYKNAVRLANLVSADSDWKLARDGMVVMAHTGSETVKCVPILTPRIGL